MPIPLKGASSSSNQDPGLRRWLVVGDSNWVPQVRRAIAPLIGEAAISHVDGFLGAIAELAVEPADVVIGPMTAADQMVESLARSLRQVAPGAKLLMVATAAQRSAAEAAVLAGFDGWVMAPLNIDGLAEALGLDRESFPAAGPFLQTSASPPLDSELGDVDLIKSILSDNVSLRSLALQVVAERSGIPNVQWASPDEPVPPGHSSAPITFDDRAFGLLRSDGAVSHSKLAAWATWLGHWMALEDQVNRLSDLSMRDELTDVWNRRYFNRFLNRVLERAVQDRSVVTLLVFDIDDFKMYNDRFGHLAGDEILRETARLMKSSVREQDVVARVGGDEFAVIFWDAEGPRRPDSRHPEDVVGATKRFQQAICAKRFPKLLGETPATLTISGGLACFPWDGRTVDELMGRADEMMMRSKGQGKNVITFGPGAVRFCQMTE